MMKKYLTSIALSIVAVISTYGADITLNGAGASFPAPVYQVWTYAYTQITPDVKVNYQSLGSGAGINQIKAGTVDFGGTDNPLTPEEQSEANLVQFPMLTGGVVLIVNLPELKSTELKLDQKTLSDIFLGNIKVWNDPAIAALNPEVKLSKTKITVVHRSDSSGTSFIFTDYLSKISPEWKEKVGTGAAVKWPVGIGGQKNPGVCNNVAKIKGSIGYTEYTYAVEAKLKCVTLKNKDGKFVAPTPKTFSASASGADWENAKGYYMVLTDTEGEDSWPITGITYILIQKDAPDKEKQQALYKYFNWCLTSGANSASKLNYVPLPKNLVEKIQNDVLK
jgi:phosphate transport system substrate-binding protein